jgi:hypothetical protein
MSDTETRSVITGHASPTPTVTGAGGCCGNPSHAALAVPEPASAAGPCCGTQAEATAEGSCCGTAAKTEAVATGRGCCG